MTLRFFTFTTIVFVGLLGVAAASASTWNTFLGGSGFAEANSVTVAPGGDLLVAGGSVDANWGSPLQPYAGNGDAFVARLSSAGSLLWNTFLGGSGADEDGRVAVDVDGNIYVTGRSQASWGAPLRAHEGGGGDAFVVRLDPSGNLVWMTFLGGSGFDRPLAIAVAPSGDVLVAGSSTATWGSPLQVFAGGETDAFVASLTPAGTLSWNTFLGSAGSDHAAAIIGGEAIFVAGGSTLSWGSPLAPHLGSQSAFIARLEQDGDIIWNSFIGGAGSDIGTALAFGPGGGVRISGRSTAPWGSPVRSYTPGGDDAFVAAMGADGTLSWHTFLGGSAEDFATGVAVDPLGNSYIVGFSIDSWGVPQNPHASPNSDEDAFVAMLDADGELLWHTFAGGSGFDLGFSAAVGGVGTLYAAGGSDANWGAPILPHTGDFAAFVARFDIPRCGNGTLDPGEGCDDGNTLDGDCCSSACEIEPLPCVPLGVCAGLGDDQLTMDAGIRRTVMRNTRRLPGQYDRWGSIGQVVLGAQQTLRPVSEKFQLELIQNDGAGGSNTLFNPTLDPSDCPGGVCFQPEGSSGDRERRARFRLRASQADVVGAEGLRRVLFARRPGPPEEFRLGLAGTDASIASPVPVGGVRRVRQSIRVGERCVTTTLDCRPIIADRFLRCGPPLCGNGVRDSGEQCGEPSLGPCGPGRVCDTCRCVRE